MQDIPLDYLGAPTLKFNTRIRENNIHFRINAPVIVYAAHLAHYPNPLPDEFEDIHESMSIVQVEDKISKEQKKILGRKSGMLKIFKKAYPEGIINIPLKNNGFNVKGVPLVMWFKYDQNAGGPVTCGGKEINISNSNGPFFARCNASSEYRGSSCVHAFNEKMRDAFGQMWYTRGEGVGAWIEVKFKGLFVVTKFQFRDRRVPLERNSRFEFAFDDGSRQTFDLRNNDEIKEFNFDPVKTSSVKITIRGVFGTINNGGAFKIFGVPCTNIEQEPDNPSQNKLAKVTGVKQPTSIPPLFKNDDHEMIKLRCHDSLSSSKKFDPIVKSVGSKVLIYCAETCVYTDYNIYGDLVYAKDTAICKSAFHSQKLQAEGGKVWLVFQNGRSNYRSQVRNGIRSNGKSKSDISISFEAYLKPEEIIVEPGSKIDLANPYRPGWIGAIINKVDFKSPKRKVLTVSIEGASSPPITVNYPDKSRIQPCGDYVKNRDCNGSRRNLNKKHPIKIRFTPEDYYENGSYLPDYGNTYGYKNRPFGWNKSMKGRIRQYNEAPIQELHTFIEFPPSKKSKICSAPTAQCPKVSWSARVGVGRYFVRLFVGDPQANTKVDLSVNGIKLADNKIVKKGKLKIFEGVVESINEFLVIKNKCETNCDFAAAKLNAVEFTPYEDVKPAPLQPTNEIPTTCGHAFRGGRCDTGPNVLHCLFSNPSAQVAGNCTGSQVLMIVPPSYQCKDQVGKYKCMKKIYKTDEDCQKFCVNNCKKNRCIN